MSNIFNAEQVNEWIQIWMDDHSDEETAPDDFLPPNQLRMGAASILGFARDAGLITQEQYQQGLNPIVKRTHPELKEEYFGTWGKRYLE